MDIDEYPPTQPRCRRRGGRLLGALAALALGASACSLPSAATGSGGSTAESQPTIPRAEPPITVDTGTETARQGELDAHIATLSQSDETLNVQAIADGSASSRDALDTVETERAEGNTVVSCTSTDYDLRTNFSEVAILRPTNGVVYPGALVRADSSLLDGVPVPLGIEQGPVSLSVDLPGIGEAGALRIEQPTNSSVQVAVDGALDWWNRNAYIDGHVNAANSSFQYRTAYSSQQAALDVGLNVAWASGDFAGRLSIENSSQTRTTMATFKQAFYTVSVDTPTSPASMIAPSVELERARAALTPESAPAYVASVVYGRILMVRMESSRDVTAAEAEAALNYAAGVRVEATANARYDAILEESSLEVITLGGNAAVQSQLIDPSTLPQVIQGENAIYSTGNPGVPIAYSVRHLHDNSLAKLGYTTEYTATECVTDQVGNTVKVTLIRFQAINDCDGIEGDGDFAFRAGVLDGAGRAVPDSAVATEATLGDGAYVNVLREVYFDVAWEQGESFTVTFTGSEGDTGLGGSWNDDRMDGATTSQRHVYNAATNNWTNLTPSSTGLGGTFPQANQLKVGSGSCTAELHYVVDFL